MRATILWTLQYFDYRDLPEDLQQVVRPFHHLAGIVAGGPQNLETACSLRYLLFARDAAIRAVTGHAPKDE